MQSFCAARFFWWVLQTGFEPLLPGTYKKGEGIKAHVSGGMSACGATHHILFRHINQSTKDGFFARLPASQTHNTRRRLQTLPWEKKGFCSQTLNMHLPRGLNRQTHTPKGINKTHTGWHVGGDHTRGWGREGFMGLNTPKHASPSLPPAVPYPWGGGSFPRPCSLCSPSRGPALLLLFSHQDAVHLAVTAALCMCWIRSTTRHE